MFRNDIMISDTIRNSKSPPLIVDQTSLFCRWIWCDNCNRGERYETYAGYIKYNHISPNFFNICVCILAESVLAEILWYIIIGGILIIAVYLLYLSQRKTSNVNRPPGANTLPNQYWSQSCRAAWLIGQNGIDDGKIWSGF